MRIMQAAIKRDFVIKLFAIAVVSGVYTGQIFFFVVSLPV